MTHLERARATIAKIKNDIIVADNLGAEPTPAIELLVTEFAQVTNEALERAAEESERHSEAQFAMIEKNPSEANLHNFAGNVLETNAALIRSLKVSP